MLKNLILQKTWGSKSNNPFLVIIWENGKSKIWSGHKSQKLAIKKQNSENKGGNCERLGWKFEAVINK